MRSAAAAGSAFRTSSAICFSPRSTEVQRGFGAGAAIVPIGLNRDAGPAAGAKQQHGRIAHHHHRADEVVEQAAGKLL